MNERMNLIEFMKKRKMNKKQIADEIKVTPQMLSRAILHPNKTRHILPPSIKYGLLKYLDFDVEENIVDYHKKFLPKAQKIEGGPVKIDKNVEEGRVINISIKL